MKKQDILNIISDLENQRVSANDCDCLTGMGWFHECSEWAEEKNKPINTAINELEKLLK